MLVADFQDDSQVISRIVSEPRPLQRRTALSQLTYAWLACDGSCCQLMVLIMKNINIYFADAMLVENRPEREPPQRAGHWQSYYLGSTFTCGETSIAGTAAAS